MGINRLLCQAQSKSGRMLIEKIQEPQNPQSICEDCLGLLGIVLGIIYYLLPLSRIGRIFFSIARLSLPFSSRFKSSSNSGVDLTSRFVKVVHQFIYGIKTSNVSSFSISH